MVTIKTSWLPVLRANCLAASRLMTAVLSKVTTLDENIDNWIINRSRRRCGIRCRAAG